MPKTWEINLVDWTPVQGCACGLCAERRKHLHVRNEFRSPTNLMGGPPMPQRHKKISETIAEMRPTPEHMAQWLMEGNIAQINGMLAVKMVEKMKDPDVRWPLGTIIMAVEQALRRYGFVLENHAGAYSARSYRSDRLP